MGRRLQEIGLRGEIIKGREEGSTKAHGHSSLSGARRSTHEDTTSGQRPRLDHLEDDTHSTTSPEGMRTRKERGQESALELTNETISNGFRGKILSEAKAMYVAMFTWGGVRVRAHKGTIKEATQDARVEVMIQ